MAESLSTTYQLIIAYRGTAYAGWQRQANALSVQQLIEEALAGLLGHRTTVVAASRTDAGVHARAQSAHLILPAPFAERGLVHGGNFRLPEDVRILSAQPRPPGFHARRFAKGKLYRYRLVRCRVLSPLEAWSAIRVDPCLDIARMAEASTHLIGCHDFGAFALAGGSHTHSRRTVFDARWEEDGDALNFWIEGDGFLRGMVRSLVGTLIEVGMLQRSGDHLAELLAGGSRQAAGRTAPPHGLVLERVRYELGRAPQEPLTADDGSVGAK